MVTATRHDPIKLFSFALREGDWVLADLLAHHLAGVGGRLQRELDERAGQPGQPASLPELHRLARLSRNLGLVENGVERRCGQGYDRRRDGLD